MIERTVRSDDESLLSEEESDTGKNLWTVRSAPARRDAASRPDRFFADPAMDCFSREFRETLMFGAYMNHQEVDKGG